MTETITMSREAMAELLDKIREDLAARVAPEEIERRLAGARFGYAYNHPGWPALPPLSVCEGSAHANPHIDNCLSCAPRWGFLGPAAVCR